MGKIAFDRRHGGINSPATTLDFSVSTNPFEVPSAVLDAYHQAASAIGFYPEPYAETLTAAIAERLGVKPASVLAGNGSTQLFYLIARVLRPRRPLVVIPTFSEIANSLSISGATPRPIMLRRDQRFQFDFVDIIAELDTGADGLFFGRPNSPTGSTLDLDMMSEIARRCAASGCWCVVDEAFIDFAEESTSAVRLVELFERLIIVRSMTKLYAIPGLRLGYLVASERLRRDLAHALEPWSVSAPAAAVGVACLAQPDAWLDKVRAVISVERAFLEHQLAAIPTLRVYPSVANFLMFEKLSGGTTRLNFYLRERGIAIRDLAELPGAGPGFYRIGVRSRSDNLRLLEAMRDFNSNAGET
jgi:threonine-phosphate decarboxylase